MAGASTSTAPNYIKANISVEFKLSCAGAGADKGITVEADDTLNGDCIRYGDLFYFKVYSWGLPKGYRMVTSDTSAVPVSGGMKSESKEESITFANEDTASTSYPIDSMISTVWHGNSLGVLSRVGMTQVKAASVGVAAATFSYTTSYTSYSFTISPKTSETYPVIVFIEENP